MAEDTTKNTQNGKQAVKRRSTSKTKKNAISVDAQKEINALEISLRESKKNEKKLKKQVKDLEARSKNEARFFSNLTHELRTPLHAVISFTNLLMMEHMDEKQEGYLKSLKFSADNLLMLINNILDMGKLNENKVQLEESEFDLVTLLKETKSMLQNKMKDSDKDIEFILNMDPKIPQILIGDLLRVSQVLNNLITNAIKFTEKGYIKIGAELVYQLPDSIMLKHTVEDTGIGIAKDRQAKIFEAFEQAEVSTTREYGGTGLGLAITKKILAAQDSKIELESELGKGSKFTFCLKYQLPKNQEVAAENTGKNEPIVVKEGHFRNFKVLIVEDNPINQMIAKSFMENWFIEHEVVSNGQEGVDEVQRNQYDLVFMDLQMPILNGFDATKKIRELGGVFAKMPIIALSASTLGKEVEQSIQVGMDKFITKPFKPEDFYDVLNDYQGAKLDRKKAG